MLVKCSFDGGGCPMPSMTDTASLALPCGARNWEAGAAIAGGAFHAAVRSAGSCWRATAVHAVHVWVKSTSANTFRLASKVLARKSRQAIAELNDSGR